MRERSAYLIFISCASLLMIVFNRLGGARSQIRSSTGVAHAMSAQASAAAPARIFCYGDSLTAGTSPPEFQEFPYAPHLERILKEQHQHNVLVRHKGFPGWTSAQLLTDGGLSTALKAASPVEVAVLLAGTNDLGYAPDAAPIVENIVALHRVCLAAGVSHTIAVGIPPSAYQGMYEEAAQKAAAVNDGLARYCQEEQRANFLPFPFPFVQGDDKWSTDGLHFSPKGYQVLGESLAPIVHTLLASS